MQGKKPYSEKINKILRNRRGFMIVIGMGIVALTCYYGIMVQKQMITSVQEIKRSNNLFQAQSVAKSIGNYISAVVDKHEGGFSTNDTVKCVYKYGVLDQKASTTDSLCTTGYFNDIGLRQKNNDITIKLTVKGKEKIGQANLQYSQCVGNMNSSCYGVPTPATGNAGDSALCEAYREKIGAQSTGLTSAVENSDIDNPCNWNKLIFGSSMTDRVAIPLYYDSSDFPQGTLDGLATMPPSSTTDSFSQTGGANNFILRVRTPCLPCVVEDSTGNMPPVVQHETRNCKPTNGTPYSPYYCSDDDRYVLDTKSDDMVVSWQITGQCGASKEECGMIQFKEMAANQIDKKSGFSAIIESLINTSHRIIDTNNPEKPRALNTTTYDRVGDILVDTLKTMTKPVFSMLLNGKLISDKGQNVPYLEYQFLSDAPVGQATIESEIEVIVNGTYYRERLYKDEKRPLVDFAVQN